MRRLIKILLLMLAVMMLSGCGLKTVDQLYCLPKRSQAYNNLQAVIDEAMDGLSFSAPMYGENRQTVQLADLDGDGVDEYLLFARDNSEKPLKILIFSQLASGYVLMDTIEGYGMDFDFVEYAQLDDRPGLEIVVGRQVSEQVVRSLSVYRFSSGIARQLLSTAYSRLSVCDLNQDEQFELFLLNHSTAEDGKGHVMLYDYHDGEMRRSEEKTISVAASAFSRFTEGTLEDGRHAMFVTCETEGLTMVTDVFVAEGRQIIEVSKGIRTEGFQNYRVYPCDIDGDGVMELARSIPMTDVGAGSKQHFLQWYSLNGNGTDKTKQYTYHNYAEGWFAVVDPDLLERLCVELTDEATVFSLLENGKKTVMVSVLLLTDADRETEAKQEGRIILYKGDAMIYVADISQEAKDKGITLDMVKRAFFPIRAEIATEED